MTVIVEEAEDQVFRGVDLWSWCIRKLIGGTLVTMTRIMFWCRTGTDPAETVDKDEDGNDVKTYKEPETMSLMHACQAAVTQARVEGSLFVIHRFRLLMLVCSASALSTPRSSL